jgi:predicted enzyme related to lactoylglutathione lyase
MAEIKEYTPGTFCWVELSTTDQDGAKQFYQQLLGLEVRDVPFGEGAIYSILTQNDLDVAAITKQDPQQAAHGVPPNWLSYVSVSNVDESAKKAAELGGQIVAGPFDVMDVGKMAVGMDPTGAAFAMWQPGHHIGARIANVPGTWCWNELGTNDIDAAGKFYSNLFGWGINAMDMGGMIYTMFESGQKHFGGMYKITPEMGPMPPNWMVYFAVADCDQSAEKAGSLGGKVIMPPADIPNVGRFALIQDPQGAFLGIIKLNNPA